MKSRGLTRFGLDAMIWNALFQSMIITRFLIVSFKGVITLFLIIYRIPKRVGDINKAANVEMNVVGEFSNDAYDNDPNWNGN